MGKGGFFFVQKDFVLSTSTAPFRPAQSIQSNQSWREVSKKDRSTHQQTTTTQQTTTMPPYGEPDWATPGDTSAPAPAPAPPAAAPGAGAASGDADSGG